MAAPHRRRTTDEEETPATDETPDTGSARHSAPPPSLLACAEMLVRCLRTHPVYADDPASWSAMDDALRLHTDGNVALAWSHLVRLVAGATGPLVV